MNDDDGKTRPRARDWNLEEAGTTNVVPQIAEEARAPVDHFIGGFSQPGGSALTLEEIRELTERDWAGES